MSAGSLLDGKTGTSASAPPVVSTLNDNPRKGHVMNRRTLTTISVVVLCGIAICMTLPTRKVSAQKAVAHSGSVQNVSNHEAANQQDNRNDPPGSIYNPYPPGILPPDL